MIVKTKHFYTLQESIKLYMSWSYNWKDLFPVMCGTSLSEPSTICYKMYQDGYLALVRTYTSLGGDKYINDIWNYVARRFQDEFSIESDDELETHDDIKELFASFIIKFLNIFDLTKLKYTTLIDFYNTSATKLMDGIKSSSSSTNRQNDTPLNGGDYSDDPHTSFITQGTGEAIEERDSPIARLDEINNKMAKLYLQWSNEFERIFLEV